MSDQPLDEDTASSWTILDGTVNTIDAPIASLVEHLNLNGIRTVSSCSTHGIRGPIVIIHYDDLEKLETLGFPHQTQRRCFDDNRKIPVIDILFAEDAADAPTNPPANGGDE